MALSPIPGPAFRSRTFSNVQPFTYEDGLTVAEVLSRLIKWFREEVVPAFGDVTEYVDQQISEMIAYVDDAVQQIINDSIEVQDPVAAALVRDETSETRSALDGSFVQRKHTHDGSAPYSEIFNHSTAATLHLTGGEQDRPYILGIGNDAGSSPGILVANKANGTGLYVANNPDATGRGIFGAQRSDSMFAQFTSTVSTTSPLLQLEVAGGTPSNNGQPLLRLMQGNGVIATFTRGDIQFYRNLHVGAVQTLFTNPLNVSNNERSGVFMRPTGPVFKASSGDGQSWFNTRINADGEELSLESGGAWGFSSGGNFNKVVTITSNSRLGFHGATPVAQQVRPGYPSPEATNAQLATNLNTIITKLVEVGLWKNP